MAAETAEGKGRRYVKTEPQRFAVVTVRCQMLADSLFDAFYSTIERGEYQ